MLQHILMVAVGGAFGSLCRYGLSMGVYSLLGREFPWGTAFVNLVGCFLFGLVWVMAEEKNMIPEEYRILILVGFLGGLTTFSTFVFESSGLIHHGDWLRFGLNVMAQNILGLMALYLGFSLGRLL
ncbi:fluoride efflux transporter CrcB [Desulfobotulus sp. H1]|uniref:Fluoride-specific ion channel FluC n=1 Tax=Desulfobotulus pelophilus TaxID=2823377 RepID=A0ABT3N5W6_9BACT|nr:fluoride efflux transporter CrcB [Desulfobotulus pelophilus]MCW7752844.1 fluoride efflux transporter CrcB [Desulfobotulus pelophilus]